MRVSLYYTNIYIFYLVSKIVPSNSTICLTSCLLSPTLYTTHGYIYGYIFISFFPEKKKESERRANVCTFCFLCQPAWPPPKKGRRHRHHFFPSPGSNETSLICFMSFSCVCPYIFYIFLNVCLHHLFFI